MQRERVNYYPQRLVEMSSLVDTRNNSAMFKRAEQLKRWDESDTSRESTQPRLLTERKIKFSLGCVFLAACMAGDKDEVLRLIEMGADIDTANVDGLTALHQVSVETERDQGNGWILLVQALVGGMIDRRL